MLISTHDTRVLLHSITIKDAVYHLKIPSDVIILTVKIYICILSQYPFKVIFLYAIFGLKSLKGIQINFLLFMISLI